MTTKERHSDRIEQEWVIHRLGNFFNRIGQKVEFNYSYLLQFPRILKLKIIRLITVLYRAKETGITFMIFLLFVEHFI